ncbi:protein borderless [Anastrepha ludens]|uniref:protein borderless n=1 Tax=Anastrepha ludens TaxID=28586 RepID=UPI0023AFE856|nr:protein borderless [Anastrepha ludens]XP_053958173.1 protein borderless [Anastrepha ludens]XP_053958174.1 protein borderless [Anastrepha ludens]XP_053958175.1 protein borderless [Anastrepha ludens]XP_053958176.1 protein borderless [Anastrepha ludens]XP_053958177.1 protein borderless [Anastrepha ludens]XP_053958178.1 protein borderless [Anastrepha ludens]XP_053958179.1 protein borderless [Anastrepha ludens]
MKNSRNEATVIVIKKGKSSKNFTTEKLPTITTTMSTASTSETDATIMNSWLCNNSNGVVRNAKPCHGNNNNNINHTNNNDNNNKWAATASLRPAVVALALALLFLINISCAACARDRLHKQTHLEAKVGSHVVFNCPIDFPYDVPIEYWVNWSKDNKKIFTWYEGESITSELFNGRLSLVTNHPEYGKASVNLTAIRESDQGWYHCQIIFPNRTPSVRNNGTLFHLAVQGGSLIKIPPVNQTIMEGQTAFFHCVMKYPETSSIVWYKDGTPLEEVQDLMRRCHTGPDGSLSIDPTMMSDLGEYECRVNNTEGEFQFAKAFLNIQYKAKVIYAPPEVYLPFGQPAVLDCHFRANPPLKNLRWEKDGLLFDSYNVPGVFYKSNGSLYFSKVDESTAGSYTCTPYNDLGTDGPSPIISVIVLRPPIFSITPKPIYIQKLGETAELPCEAIDRDGNNRPTIVWSRKDGSPLPDERHTINAGNLIITNLVETDRGMYECSATNEAATITAETELMIENIAPRPPYNLTANSTETAITVRWQPGYLRPNLEYTVWYRLTESPEWRTLRILQKNIMETTIQSLQPGREYEFMVLSQDKYGDGMFSKTLRFSTQQSSIESNEANTLHESNPLASSISPPWNLTATNNVQGWLLHWQHPKRGSESVRLYTVRWWKEPEHFLIGTIETFDNFYQLRHLKEDAIFKIQVIATSINGEQVAGDVLTIEVPSHRKTRALLIGSTVGIIFLLCALVAFLYVKRSCLRHLFVSGGNDDDTKDSEKMNNT